MCESPRNYREWQQAEDEILTSGSVGGASGNRRIYPEADGGAGSQSNISANPPQRLNMSVIPFEHRVLCLYHLTIFICS